VTPDPYEICRHIRHYYQKNNYAPKRDEVEHWCGGAEFFEQLVKNDVVEVLPIAEGGPPVAVVLTEKGFRMATVERRAGGK
jgi:hypothetical protein